MSNYLKAFNSHLVDFMNDLLTTLNNEDKNEMEAYKIFVEKIIKTNVKMIIKIWNAHIVNIYMDKIQNDDFGFFLNKDYDNISNNNKNIENLINKIKEIVRGMNEENREKSLKYIKNLCKLCSLYFN